MQNNYDQLLEETKTKILSIVELKPENQWTLDTNKDGYVIYTRNNPENGLKINRTETNAAVDPEEFVNFVIDMTRKKEYDANFLEGRLIDKLDEKTFIFYARGKPPTFFIDARDFCLLSRVYKLGDDHFMTITKSIEHPQVPPVKGVQRGEIVFSAWIVKKQPNGQTNIIIIGNMNPKGDIPKAIINQGAKFQAEGVKKAVEYLTKNKKK
ncbi:unnamed protein product [Paramecium octaurelia]|uniref:START domain-containing protein n=1 Tax=Paramecium octaurelia TaxID=43137 RepID=A0A8S1SN64_PAROT|nr:unnamed protein product [Paramecium octaurelia]